MSSSDRVEQFCTLFDSNFLLQGLALHASLSEHSTPFHLWVVCMDESVERTLRQLSLPHVSLLPITDIETEELRAVKPSRTAGEYCWTVTPFVCPEILRRAPQARRVTYVDADLMFFDTPRILLDELDASGKDVLITDHAYAPEYDQSQTSGRFCVQFITFNRSTQAARVAAWWQARCIEWCFARLEDGKFGDQKYLDVWPELFGDAVHISSYTDRTLAPWNVRSIAARAGTIRPIFFHFHGLRRYGSDHLQLYLRYRVGIAARPIYAAYVKVLRTAAEQLRDAGIQAPVPARLTVRERAWMWHPRLRAQFVRFPG